MASLMPLQKSITPWKVESGEFWGGSIQSPHQEGKKSIWNREGSCEAGAIRA